MINGIIFSLLIPFLGTTLGAAFVFLLHDKIAAKVQNTLLGFASGVMVAAAGGKRLPSELSAAL